MEEDAALEQTLRKPGARGEPVALAVGGAWRVPTLRARFRLTPDGVVASPPTVPPALLEKIDRLIAMAPSDPEALLAEPACAACCFETAYEALAVNYDLTPEIAERILTVHVLPDILAALLGKKKRATPPGGDTSRSPSPPSA